MSGGSGGTGSGGGWSGGGYDSGGSLIDLTWLYNAAQVVGQIQLANDLVNSPGLELPSQWAPMPGPGATMNVTTATITLEQSAALSARPGGNGSPPGLLHDYFYYLTKPHKMDSASQVTLGVAGGMVAAPVVLAVGYVLVIGTTIIIVDTPPVVAGAIIAGAGGVASGALNPAPPSSCPATFWESVGYITSKLW